MCSEHWDALPPAIEKLKAEVEAAGKKIDFKPLDKLAGAMKCDWENGVPIITANRYSHAGAAEELLHLLLDLRGYSRIQPGLVNNYSNAALHLLHNMLQHAVIFPRLELLGYTPDETECGASKRHFAGLTSYDLDPVSLPYNPERQAMLALLYVRARRHCPSGEMSREMSDLFHQPEYSEVKDLGKRILDEITLDENSTPEQYNVVLRRCLVILGFGDEVCLVDPTKQCRK